MSLENKLQYAMSYEPTKLHYDTVTDVMTRYTPHHLSVWKDHSLVQLFSSLQEKNWFPVKKLEEKQVHDAVFRSETLLSSGVITPSTAVILDMNPAIGLLMAANILATKNTHQLVPHLHSLNPAAFTLSSTEVAEFLHTAYHFRHEVFLDDSRTRFHGAPLFLLNGSRSVPRYHPLFPPLIKEYPYSIDRIVYVDDKTGWRTTRHEKYRTIRPDMYNHFESKKKEKVDILYTAQTTPLKNYKEGYVYKYDVVRTFFEDLEKNDPIFINGSENIFSKLISPYRVEVMTLFGPAMIEIEHAVIQKFVKPVSNSK